MPQKNISTFPVTDLAFDKDRKPWGKPNDATALLMLSAQSGIISMVKGADGKPLVVYTSNIEPVIHEEGRSMDD